MSVPPGVLLTAPHTGLWSGEILHWSLALREKCRQIGMLGASVAFDVA